MKASQRAVLGIGAALLALNFLFPWSSYPTRGPETPQRDGTITVSHKTTYGFVPVWKVIEAKRDTKLPGNVFDDTIIQWPIVLGFALIVTVACGMRFYRLSRQMAPGRSPQL